ncbi:hypothetical protein [Variovorax sp. UC122_21]|uniref:hypothetical protein n=1 Tax=Variovorax sp. UC122_21 TaxID=3374554 RepID=UPI0037580ED4
MIAAFDDQRLVATKAQQQGDAGAVVGIDHELRGDAFGVDQQPFDAAFGAVKQVLEAALHGPDVVVLGGMMVWHLEVLGSFAVVGSCGMRCRLFVVARNMPAPESFEINDLRSPPRRRPDDSGTAGVCFPDTSSFETVDWPPRDATGHIS